MQITQRRSETPIRLFPEPVTQGISVESEVRSGSEPEFLKPVKTAATYRCRAGFVQHFGRHR